MNVMFDTTPGLRAAWQREAVAALAAILRANRHLPPIMWTVSCAGGTLIGRVVADARVADGAREGFDAWRQALGASETSALGGGLLVATARVGQVKVTINARVEGRQGGGAGERVS